MNIKNKKQRILHVEELKSKKEVVKKKSDFRIDFLQMIKEGDYVLNSRQFLILSFAVAGIASALYFYVFRSMVLSIGVFIPFFLAPFFAVCNNAIIDKKIKDIAAYKHFVEVIEAELTITNSTQEAIKNARRHHMHKNIQSVLDNIVRNIQLGESTKKALQIAEHDIEEQRLKMVFSILDINQSVGSAESLNGLRGIKRDLDVLNSNVLDFKDKCSGTCSENFIFYALELLLPIAMEIYQSGYFSDLMELGWVIPFAISLLMFGAIAGQYIVLKKVQSTLGAL